MRLLLLVLLAALLLGCVQGAFNRFNKKEKPKPMPKPAPVVLDVTVVPSLESILEEIGLSDWLPKLIRMGVTENRLLLRLQPMDYRVMEMEWEDVQRDQIVLLKSTVEKYYVIAKEAGDRILAAPKLNKDRDKLTYGRVTMPGGVQSFEYALASFGGIVPRIPMSLQLAEYPHTGCRPPELSEIASLEELKKRSKELEKRASSSAVDTDELGKGNVATGSDGEATHLESDLEKLLVSKALEEESKKSLTPEEKENREIDKMLESVAAQEQYDK